MTLATPCEASTEGTVLPRTDLVLSLAGQQGFGFKPPLEHGDQVSAARGGEAPPGAEFPGYSGMVCVVTVPHVSRVMSPAFRYGVRL
ncbi:hypothetical protein D3C86_935590 [compost metagenome]